MVACSDLVDRSGVEVDQDCPRYILSMRCLVEKHVGGVLGRGVFLEFALGSDAVLLCEELPAGATYLDACLTHMDSD